MAVAGDTGLEVQVDCLTGTMCVVQASAQWTIGVLKAEIKQATACPACEQKLISDGAVLEASVVLGELPAEAGKLTLMLVRTPPLEDGIYKVFNLHFLGTLFCGDGTDESGDHRVWMAKGKDYETGGKERWAVQRQDNGTYKLFSLKWNGPLFCRGEDQQLWASCLPDFTASGREFWDLIEVAAEGTFNFKLQNHVRRHGVVEPTDDVDRNSDHFAYLCDDTGGGKAEWTFEKVAELPTDLHRNPVPQPCLADGVYKLFNGKWRGPLFCGDGKEENTHSAWVPNNVDHEDNGAERFRLELQADNTYKIFNMKWAGPLLCRDETNHIADRRACFHEKPEHSDEGKEQWAIIPQSDGTYKLFNTHWRGPLLCGDRCGRYGDHKVWVEQRPSFENGGKARWRFQLVEEASAAEA